MLAFVYDDEFGDGAAEITYAARILLDEIWDETRCFSAREYASAAANGDGGIRAVLHYGERELPAPIGGSAVVDIRSSAFFRHPPLEREIPGELPLPLLDGTPVLFGAPIVRRGAKRLATDADLLASAYFLVTRFEEVLNREARDPLGRFPGRSSLPVRAGFIHRPVVDEYSDLVRNWFDQLGAAFPAGQRRFSVLLTHDVDTLGLYRDSWALLRTLAGWIPGRASSRSLSEYIAVKCGRRQDPMGAIDAVLEMDRAIDAESCFFFMAGGRTARDGNYKLRWKRTREVIRKLHQAGAVIGLHASYEAGCRPERIAAEKAALEEACGFPIHRNRHHFLAWKSPEDGRWLEAAGICWDSTLGYADTAGFRLGVCRPIPLFDPVNRQPLAIEEHPLLVMDCTLDRPTYMGLASDEALAYGRGLLRETKRHRGEFVMLWHHHVFAGAIGPYHRHVYQGLLEELGG